VRLRRLSEIADVLGGNVEGADVVVSSVEVDSRRVRPGGLFVAMRGDRADGHAYVGDAFAAGAVAAIVRAGGPTAPGPTVRVAETEGVLLRLAAEERDVMKAVVVGITGANGKTSTKDFAAAIIGTRLRTHASPASFNNEVGVPLTILGAPDATEALVLEMGARRAGDLELLSRLARPDVVVVTNVGVAHIEIFGSWDAIVRSAAEPVAALVRDGVAVLNADDPIVRDLRRPPPERTVLFGTSEEADVRARDVRLDDGGRASFSLDVGGQSEPVALGIPGEHMVSNALAAAAAATSVGMTLAECSAGLKGASISAWRMEMFTTDGGLVIVNDAYNANPESMAAGLKAARWIARGTRLVAVVGPMAELGPVALEEHERLGDLAARLRVDRLIAVGEDARPIAMAAIRQGAGSDDVVVVDTPEEAAAAVRAWVVAGDVVFVKGSRVAGLERVAEALR
jgi:UDP-N-acetylmuramoyl-tripeptide--D-alanyl-D-alanine ligase